MAGGMYAALSGMSVKLQDIDRVATDLANIGTSGYKTEQQAASAAERGQFRRDLDSAIDVMSGDRKLDMRPGLIASTGRDLDVAIEGNGFFVVQTPQGERYTRDGGFLRRGDGVLATRDGNPVMGQDGEIQIGNGAIKIGEDGTIRAGTTVAGRLKVVSFDAPGDIVRESGARFRAAANVVPVDSAARVVGGSLESANVSVVERMATLTSITRAFEGLQRGISVLANDIDGRAITELGRR
jgi:flagellar basal-body rod protein FlgF